MLIGAGADPLYTSLVDGVSASPLGVATRLSYRDDADTAETFTRLLQAAEQRFAAQPGDGAKICDRIFGALQYASVPPPEGTSPLGMRRLRRCINALIHKLEGLGGRVCCEFVTAAAASCIPRLLQIALNHADPPAVDTGVAAAAVNCSSEELGDLTARFRELMRTGGARDDRGRFYRMEPYRNELWRAITEVCAHASDLGAQHAAAALHLLFADCEPHELFRKYSSLEKAAVACSTSAVRVLLAAEPQPLSDESAKTVNDALIMLCSRLSHNWDKSLQKEAVFIAKKLIAAGAHPAHVNSNGETALVAAARHGDAPLLSYFCSQVTHEQLLDTDAEGDTALAAAASDGYSECVETVVDSLRAQLAPADGEEVLAEHLAGALSACVRRLVEDSFDEDEEDALSTKAEEVYHGGFEVDDHE